MLEGFAVAEEGVDSVGGILWIARRVGESGEEVVMLGKVPAHGGT